MPQPAYSQKDSLAAITWDPIKEAQRWGADAEQLGYLQRLLDAQQLEPLSRHEQRAVSRARQLIRGRGWPTERIQPLFLSDQQLKAIALSSAFGELSASEASEISAGPWRPWCLGPTAVGIPRSAVAGLGELEVTRVLIHEFVHARSWALPTSNSLPADWTENIGLYQLNEGITELIAEDILPMSERMAEQAPLLVATREASAELCQQAGFDLPDLERLASPEVIVALSNALDLSYQQLGAEMEALLNAERRTY